MLRTAVYRCDLSTDYGLRTLNGVRVHGAGHGTRQSTSHRSKCEWRNTTETGVGVRYRVTAHNIASERVNALERRVTKTKQAGPTRLVGPCIYTS